MKTTTAETSARALQILRESWGKSRTLTRKEAEWLANTYDPERVLPVATSVEMALKLAGFWDKYLAAGLPTWAAFRAWLKETAQ